ncbi:BON domain-containing protein [Paraburkholderia silvatlantica]|uniref:BON domain-containing protein n=1 Tax=Paraburkholderia silvatlantica TaxID=321895 RepID=UPI003751EE31
MRSSGKRRLIGALLAVAMVNGATCASAQTSTGSTADTSAQTGAVAASTQRGRSDTMLAGDVRRALVRTPGLNSMNIQVRVRSGIVTLTGSVPQHSQIARAGNAARSVRGVRAVTNRLTLRTGPGAGRRAASA